MQENHTDLRIQNKEDINLKIEMIIDNSQYKRENEHTSEQ